MKRLGLGQEPVTHYFQTALHCWWKWNIVVHNHNMTAQQKYSLWTIAQRYTQALNKIWKNQLVIGKSKMGYDWRWEEGVNHKSSILWMHVSRCDNYFNHIFQIALIKRFITNICGPGQHSFFGKHVSFLLTKMQFGIGSNNQHHELALGLMRKISKYPAFQPQNNFYFWYIFINMQR